MKEQEILDRTDKRMDATVADAQGKFATVRTGRASLARAPLPTSAASTPQREP